MREEEFIKKLNELCAEKGCKTNFAHLDHLARYIVGAEGLISPWRDEN